MPEFVESLLDAVPGSVSRLADVLAAFGPLDVVLVLITLALAVRAAIRGLVAEAFGIAAVVAGVAVAAVLVVPASRYVDGIIGSESFWNRVIAFLVLFLATYAGLKMIEFILRRISESLHLKQLDHLFGLVLGVGEGAIIGTVLIAGLKVQPWFDVGGLLDGSIAVEVVEQTFGLERAASGSVGGVR